MDAKNLVGNCQLDLLNPKRSQKPALWLSKRLKVQQKTWRHSIHTCVAYLKSHGAPNTVGWKRLNQWAQSDWDFDMNKGINGPQSLLIDPISSASSAPGSADPYLSAYNNTWSACRHGLAQTEFSDLIWKWHQTIGPVALKTEPMRRKVSINAIAILSHPHSFLASMKREWAM